MNKLLFMFLIFIKCVIHMKRRTVVYFLRSLIFLSLSTHTADLDDDHNLT